MQLDDYPWIATAQGRKYHYLAHDINEIHIEDMARANSRDCRYGGHLMDEWDGTYSVTQHQVYVYRLLVRMEAPTYTRPWGLTHDCPEGYWRDIMTPMKGVLPNYKPNEDKCAELFRRKYGIPYDDNVEAYVKWADHQLYFAERQKLVAPIEDDQTPLPEFTLDEIDPDFYLWSPSKAREEFFAAFEEIQHYCIGEQHAHAS